MTDTTPTRPRHDTDREAVSPTEAAHRLGVTPDAVRARLRRGTLPGERVDGEWRVHMPRRPEPPPPSARRDANATPTATRHDDDTTGVGALIAAKDDAIAAQREEIAFLREQLDHSRRELAAERERFDVIHREALHRIEALTAGDAGAGEPRQDAPLASPAGRSGAHGSPRPPGAAAGEAGSWVAHLWRRVRGSG